MHALLTISLAALSLSAAHRFDDTAPKSAALRAEATAPAESLRLGPPAICLPLEVRGKTLRWGEGPLTPPKDYPLDKLRKNLMALLESEDTLTRMENLRRAAILLGPLHRGVDSALQARVRIDLLSSLRNRALTAMLDEKQASHAAHCVFDLGYLQAALTQVDGRGSSAASSPDFGDGAAELRYVGKALPKSGAVALGLSLGLFDLRGGRAELAQFLHCAKLAASDVVLQKNLKTAAHHFLAKADYDELVRSMAN
jgi:hypothetical protein